MARALEECYGSHPRQTTISYTVLDVLVETILSQHTSSVNCARAVAALHTQFPTWTDVLEAPPRRLERALKPAGLARTRSDRIKRILRTIQCERGALTLEHLRDLSDDRARDTLLAYDGVGRKTAECVLLFALGRDVFPVDTHIYRILKRVGFIPRGMSAEKAHDHLLPLIPAGAHLPLHLNLIAHGRTICRPTNPACAACVLRQWCFMASPIAGN